MTIEIFQGCFIFMAVFFTIINFSRMYAKKNIPLANLLFQYIGIAGIVYIFWIME